MLVKNRKKHGIALMREFHSKQGIDKNTKDMLESLEATVVDTLSNPDWNKRQRQNFISVILRTAFQVGRSKK